MWNYYPQIALITFQTEKQSIHFCFGLIVVILSLVFKKLTLQVLNGSYDQPYTNPGAVTQIITGSAVSFLTKFILMEYTF